MGLGLRTDVKTGTKAKYQGKDHLHSILNKTKMKKPLNMRQDRIDRYRHLVELDLSGCCQVTGSSLEAVLAVFTRLEVLRVCGLDAVTDSTLAAVGRHLPRLRTLDLQGCCGVSRTGRDTLDSHSPHTTLIGPGAVNDTTAPL